MKDVLKDVNLVLDDKHFSWNRLEMCLRRLRGSLFKQVTGLLPCACLGRRQNEPVNRVWSLPNKHLSSSTHTPVYVIGAEVEQMNNIRFLEINITENLFLIWETDRAYLILCAISFALAICLHYNQYQYGHIFTYCTENLHRYSEYNFKPSQIRCILIWHVRGSGGSMLT